MAHWLESLAISTWIRDSPSLWAFPMFLFVHTLGMSIVAGGNAMIDCALLGLWPSEAPIRPLERLYPVMWWAFGFNTVTGIGLLIADASTKGKNPDFWVKMALVLAGVRVMVLMRKRVFRHAWLDVQPVTRHMKALAWASLICWFGAICAGRLIAYVGPVAGID